MNETIGSSQPTSPFWSTLARLTARSATLAALVGLGLSATASDRVSNSGQTGKRDHWLQIGNASWYGTNFQGHKTATGEAFDMNRLTCAHRSLPLGSWIRVTNLRNSKSIFVRVNDRGPMIENRIIDLSLAAARAVGLSGTGKVKLEPVRAEDSDMTKDLVAQLQIPTDLLIADR